MNDLMKAARLKAIGQELRIENIKKPIVGAKDVLIEIKASGICHSDINYYYGFVPVSKLPITLGHEIAGIIAEVGDQVFEIEKGDGVCVHYVVSCGNCRFCRTQRENLCEKYEMVGRNIDGGFAEYVAVPARNVLKLPKPIPFEQGAIMGCAVSTAFHALKRGRVTQGDTVVIYGVGGVGAQAVQLASRIFDAGNILAVDVSDKKLEFAKKLGADEIINVAYEDPVDRIKAITNGQFADVVLDFVGLQKTIEKGIDCVGKGGRIVLIGIGPRDNITVSPYKSIIGKEMDIIGVNDHLRSELVELIKLTASGTIDLSSSITHRVSLEDINHGMKLLEKKVEGLIRVVIMKRAR